MLRALVWTPHCCARGDQMPSLRRGRLAALRRGPHTRHTPNYLRTNPRHEDLK